MKIKVNDLQTTTGLGVGKTSDKNFICRRYKDEMVRTMQVAIGQVWVGTK